MDRDAMLGRLVQKLAAAPDSCLGTFDDLLGKVMRDPSRWLPVLKRVARGEDVWSDGLLEPVGTIDLPALPPFDFKVHFRATPKEESDTAEVLICRVDNMRECLPIEPAVESTVLRRWRTRGILVAAMIAMDLGGNGTQPVTRSQVYEMMRRQGRGQEGDFRTDGYPNYVYLHHDRYPELANLCWCGGKGWVTKIVKISSHKIQWMPPGTIIFSC